MSDIFISYDSADRAKAQQYADALESVGWSVWWDREIPLGKAFDQVIEAELNAARCVIVLWSKEAVQSRWVKTEAAAAADRDRLIPVLIDDVAIPFEFKRIQTAMLMHWQGDVSDPEFRPVIDAVRQLLGAAPPSTATAAPDFTSSRPPVSRLAAKRVMLYAVAAGLLLVAIILAIKIGANRGALVQSTSVEPQVGGQTPSSTERPLPSRGTDKLSTNQGALAIKIGDKIADGVPVRGAGVIETPYGQNVYVFNAAPKQRVYFRQLRHAKGMAYINWRLTDADGSEIFKTCFGCTEPGVQTLTKGGTYTLTVGNDKDPATGNYELQLFDVPAAQQFVIKIGDAIKDSVPETGAGVIESPGTEDIYSFTAAPRQRVYFRIWEQSTGMSYINWQLTDANGTEVFRSCLGCSEPGVQQLVQGGAYTLTVGNLRNPASGEYAFELGSR